MVVEVQFYGAFASATADGSYDADSVADLLTALEASHADLAGRLRADSESAIRPAVVITVNKTDVRHLDGLDTKLSDGDTIRITKNAYPRR